MNSVKNKKTIGRVEEIVFPGLHAHNAHARVDTGARTSALWASVASEENGRLRVIFFGKGNPHYTGKTHYFDAFERTIVASSNGQAEERYKIRLSVKIGGKKLRARFTLADRSTQVYPVLIGRNILRGKFIVDVTKGSPLSEAEHRRSLELRAKIKG